MIRMVLAATLFACSVSAAFSVSATFSTSTTSTSTSTTEVEFLHWWTSQGETKALNVLNEQLNSHNIELRSASVVGGGGDSAMTVLQARALAGNTPHFAQIEGLAIRSWDAIGILHNLNTTAKAQEWDQHLYPLAQSINQTGNGYVALPITLHRMNWLWVNHKNLRALNLEVPSNWDELFHAMDKANQQGITPLAIGMQPWQVVQLFENLLLAKGGVDFYYQTLVQLDPTRLKSDTMKAILRDFRKLSQFVQKTQPDSKWDTATQSLAENRALFQLGGDWILGDLMARGVKVPQDIGCYAAPQTQSVFLYNMDSFIFMSRKSFDLQQANKLANVMADKNFQSSFNRLKGSIPVRKDISLRDFNPCQKQSQYDFIHATVNNLAVPSMTDSMAVNPIEQHAINSELFRFFKDTSISVDTVITRIVSIASSN